MQTPTNEVVEQAIAKQEAAEAGIDTSKKDDKDTQGDKAKDDSAGKPGVKDTDKSAGDKSADKPKDDDKDTKSADSSKEKATDEDKDAKKYTADDALEVEEQPATNSDAPTDAAGVQLTPAEVKHIADHIGEPINIVGVKEVDGKLERYEVKAYSWRDVPKDFKFTSDADMGAAGDAFTRMDQKAYQLLGQFRQDQSSSQAQDFEKRENEAIRSDVSDLQKSGLEIQGKNYKFPMFSVQPGAKGFDESPEAQQMAEVLKIMADRNDMYLKQYEQGRAYRHIGFSEAFELWVNRNPDYAADKAKDAAQDKEDEARQKTATTSDRNRGTEASNIVKPTVGAGTTTRDILARIDAMK